ncbi:MFS transporter [Agrobacterium rosae]|uniref:Major Facilitator Superfamily protein n=1 Tax=Agrobacterium rosae TaxID=1972867 RepID=A0A1R3U736_9HYPH|nr:MFS transporter [Agrobacterium rosae]SCX35137.1 Major Facilitator Superfamily protein [Agrobacterium rosae]
MRKTNVAFVTAAFCYNYTLGGHVIVLAWTSLHTISGFSSVGHVLLVGNLVNLLLAPLVGAQLDRHRKRSAFLVGSCLGLMATSTLLMTTGSNNLAWLMAGTFVFNVGALLQGPSLEVLQKGITDPVSGMDAAIFRNLIRQIGLVCGTGASGILIGIGGSALPNAVSMVFTIISAVAVGFGLHENFAAQARPNYIASLIAGGVMLRQRDIAATGAVIVLSLAAGQVINATLADVVVARGFEANVYGVADALWSVGAFGSAIVLRQLLYRRVRIPTSLLGLAGLGLAMTVLSQSSQPMSIWASCLMLGGCFSVAKLQSDGRLMEICGKDDLARVRSNLNAFTGGVGVVIYLLPTLVESLTSSGLLFSAGLILLVISVALKMSSV